MDTLPHKPGWSLPLVDWPTLDRAQWLDLSDPEDLMSSPRPQSTYRQATRKTMEKNYGIWLGWLADNRLLEPGSTPASRITRAAITAYVNELRERVVPQSVLTYLETIDSMIAAIAPEADRSFIKLVEKRLRRKMIKAGKPKHKLAPINDLYNLGFDLVAKAERGAGTALEDAITFRDGIIIVVLAATLLRRKNFHSIEIDQHLTWKGDTAVLVFPPQEMKNGQEHAVQLTREASIVLKKYIEGPRRLLMSVETATKPMAKAALWMNLRGDPLSYDGFYYIVKSRTTDGLGYPVSPHRFRNSGATSLAIEVPEDTSVIRVVLGHGSIDVASEHYILADNIKAGERFHTGLAARRREAKRRAGVVLSGRTGD